MKIKNLLLSAFLCSSMLSFSQADLPNNGISGPIHQKYIGKIVFAHSLDALAKGKENESEFVAKTTLGSGIYYRVYLDSTLVSYLKTTPDQVRIATWKIKFYIDGVESDSRIIEPNYLYLNWPKEAKTTWTTFKGALRTIPYENFTGEEEFERFLKKNVSKFTIGDHVLKIEYIPYNYDSKFEGSVVASGEITLSIKTPLFDPNDVETCLPKAVKDDKILEAKIKKAYFAAGNPEKVITIRIISPTWIIERNKSTGIVLSRHVDAVIGYTKDGECAYKELSFYQDNNGSGFANDVYLGGIGSSIRYVSCGCLK